MTLSKLKTFFKEKLSGHYSVSEIEFLFPFLAEKILNLNNIQLRKHREKKLNIDQQNRFFNQIQELQKGKPYQQILGETEFYGMKFFLDENVLIPRPETEELLELAISQIQNSFALERDSSTSLHYAQNDNSFKILDIGTGSGVIPIVLKKHFPNIEISAVDISEKALEIAKKNAKFHETEINFFQLDFINEKLKEKFDIIISNPPYIGKEEEIEIENSVKAFEPKIALFSPTSDALIFYRKIATFAKTNLNQNGMIFLEINQKLGRETLDLFQDFKNTKLIKDLSGNNRFVVVGN